MILTLIKNHFKRVWRGAETFWKVFLIWWVGGVFIVVTAMMNVLGVCWETSNMLLYGTKKYHIGLQAQDNILGKFLLSLGNWSTYSIMALYFCLAMILGIKSLPTLSTKESKKYISFIALKYLVAIFGIIYFSSIWLFFGIAPGIGAYEVPRNLHRLNAWKLYPCLFGGGKEYCL